MVPSAHEVKCRAKYSLSETVEYYCGHSIETVEVTAIFNSEKSSPSPTDGRTDACKKGPMFSGVSR